MSDEAAPVTQGDRDTKRLSSRTSRLICSLAHHGRRGRLGSSRPRLRGLQLSEQRKPARWASKNPVLASPSKEQELFLSVIQRALRPRLPTHQVSTRSASSMRGSSISRDTLEQNPGSTAVVRGRGSRSEPSPTRSREGDRRLKLRTKSPGSDPAHDAAASYNADGHVVVKSKGTDESMRN